MAKGQAPQHKPKTTRAAATATTQRLPALTVHPSRASQPTLPRRVPRMILEARPERRCRWNESERPQQDSNLRTRLRRPVLYPLSYGGPVTPKGYQSPAVSWDILGCRAQDRAQDVVTRGSLARVTHGLGRVLVVDDDEVIRQ